MNIKERFKEEGRLEGIQKGRLEGIQKGRLEVVRNMLDKKMDASLISKVTGLPKKEIQKLMGLRFDKAVSTLVSAHPSPSISR